jgi:homoserine kinase
MLERVRVRVPASTANLGPGFDSLALALDLWNEAEFTLEGSGLELTVNGEGEDRLPADRNNTVAFAFRHFLSVHGKPVPSGLKIHCRNNIPTSSGLGSSASALLLGMLGANAMYGTQAGTQKLLAMAAGVEGHADNTAAALLGGLVVAVRMETGWLARRFEVPPTLQAVVAIPTIHLPTHVARQALPHKLTREDAVFNLSRTPLVVEALQKGDMQLLGQAMQDRLHQPYRVKLIHGAAEAIEAAHAAGAAAVALSGAGPSLIAFSAEDCAPIGAAMIGAFEACGVPARVLIVHASLFGAQVLDHENQPLTLPW